MSFANLYVKDKETPNQPNMKKNVHNCAKGKEEDDVKEPLEKRLTASAVLGEAPRVSNKSMMV